MPVTQVTNPEQEKKAQAKKQAMPTSVEASLLPATVQRALSRQLQPADVQRLQQTIGNRAVTTLLTQTSSTPQIQRTKWKYQTDEWHMDSPRKCGTDEFALPEKYCLDNAIEAEEGDFYDQNTGKYYPAASWQDRFDKTEERATKKKRPKDYGGVFSKARQKTAYGRFEPYPTGGRRPDSQGPHFLAHITKRTVFDMSTPKKTSDKVAFLDSLLGSKLVPKPKQALQMMTDMLKARDIDYTFEDMDGWYQLYKKQYGVAEVASKVTAKADAISALLELHPLTTYKIGEKASKEELAGKGERGDKAIEDLRVLLQSIRKEGLPSGLETIDPGYKAEGWDEGESLREDFAYNYAYLAMGVPPSPSHYSSAPGSPKREDFDGDVVVDDADKDSEEDSA